MQIRMKSLSLPLRLGIEKIVADVSVIKFSFPTAEASR